MKIKVSCPDGNSMNTKIIQVQDDGKEFPLKNIKSVRFQVSVDEAPQMDIQIEGHEPLEVEAGRVRFYALAKNGKPQTISHVLYADGAVDSYEIDDKDSDIFPLRQGEFKTTLDRLSKLTAWTSSVEWPIIAHALALAAVMQTPKKPTQFRATHRHLKRGTEYMALGDAYIQTDMALADDAQVIVYQGRDGDMWARPVAEFNDGRFEIINPCQASEPPGEKN